MTDRLRELEDRYPLPWHVDGSNGLPCDAHGNVVAEVDESLMIDIMVAWSQGPAMIRRLAFAAGFTSAPTTPVVSMADLTEHLETHREIADEAGKLDRDAARHRAAMFLVADLLGLVVQPPDQDWPDADATAAALRRWVGARKAERDHSIMAAEVATRFGVPTEAVDADREAAQRITAVVVAELRALGWTSPAEAKAAELVAANPTLTLDPEEDSDAQD